MACSYHHKITYSWGMNFRISSHLIILHVYMCIYMYIFRKFAFILLPGESLTFRVYMVSCKTHWVWCLDSAFGHIDQELYFLTSPQHSKFLNVIFPACRLTEFLCQSAQPTWTRPSFSCVSRLAHHSYMRGGHITAQCTAAQTTEPWSSRDHRQLYRTGSGGASTLFSPFLNFTGPRVEDFC